jgi:rhomboid protease GluP
MESPALPDRAEIEFLLDILRRCADAAPAPWYPRQFAKTAGLPLGEVAADVEFLWAQGFLRSASQPGDRVPGLTLTDAGARALSDPASLAALCNGDRLPRARDAAARRTLREPGAPVVSRALLIVNLIVFGGGVFIATGRGAAQAFLAGSPGPAVIDVLHRIGSLSSIDLVAGRWWRLLAAAFVHGGLLHLVMNMSMLAFGFGIVESMWGRARYLVIYLIAAFGGNCVAMAWRPSVEITMAAGPVEFSQPVVGASGALCGILAATMVWVLFNARHLPKAVATHMRTSLIVSGVLLIFISLFPQVSGLCHLGGALFGAAAAALFHFERWGSPRVRWLAVAGLVALPWLGLRVIDHERSVDPRWHRVERRAFEQFFQQRIVDVAGECARYFRHRVEPLLDESPSKRDGTAVRKTLVEIAECRTDLARLADDLRAAGRYRDVEAERDRNAALEHTEELSTKFAKAAEALESNANTTEQNDTEERTFSRQFLRRIPATMANAGALYRAEVAPLLALPAAQRGKHAVQRLLPRLDHVRQELSELTTALREAGPYGNGDVEKARSTAERYATARLDLMDSAARCLREPDKWTDEDEANLQKQAEAVVGMRKEWENLVERE